MEEDGVLEREQEPLESKVKGEKKRRSGKHKGKEERVSGEEGASVRIEVLPSCSGRLALARFPHGLPREDGVQVASGRGGGDGSAGRVEGDHELRLWRELKAQGGSDDDEEGVEEGEAKPGGLTLLELRHRGVNFRGTRADERKGAGMPTGRYAVAVYDPKAGVLRLSEVEVPYRMVPWLSRVNDGDGSLVPGSHEAEVAELMDEVKRDEELRELSARAAAGDEVGAVGRRLTGAMRVVAKEKLIDTFGSGKAKRALNAKRDPNAGNQALLDAKAAANREMAALERQMKTEEQQAVEAMNHVRNHVPPHRPEATVPADCYPLELLMSPEERNELPVKDVLRLLAEESANAGAADDEAATLEGRFTHLHGWVARRLRMLAGHRDKKEAKRKCCALLFLNALIQFHASSLVVRSREPHVGLASRLCGGDGWELMACAHRFLEEFASPIDPSEIEARNQEKPREGSAQRRADPGEPAFSRSKDKIDRLRGFILVLALIASDFELFIAPLAQCLKVEVKTVSVLRPCQPAHGVSPRAARRVCCRALASPLL